MQQKLVDLTSCLVWAPQSIYSLCTLCVSGTLQLLLSQVSGR